MMDLFSLLSFLRAVSTVGLLIITFKALNGSVEVYYWLWDQHGQSSVKSGSAASRRPHSVKGFVLDVITRPTTQWHLIWFYLLMKFIVYFEKISNLTRPLFFSLPCCRCCSCWRHPTKVNKSISPIHPLPILLCWNIWLCDFMVLYLIFYFFWKNQFPSCWETFATSLSFCILTYQKTVSFFLTQVHGD